MDFAVAFKLLLLLFVANGAPILAQKAFGARGAWPIDNRCRLPDGEPLFGASKTWRGLLAALLITPPLAWLLGLPAMIGLHVALLAMLGDLLSSFVKRRLRIPPSGMAFGLDQVPESFLPLLVVGMELGLGLADVALLTLVFLVLELLLSRILYRLDIRKRPY
jgi:CDP-2,3-bis-(O-geranylgeranyl)-sn-glycerol synthase